MMERRRMALLVVGAVVVSATAGWFAGSQITSPAEAAARAAAPEPSPILVSVESRVLSSDVVTRGTARFGSPQRLVIAPSALKPALGIVARIPALGTDLVEGDVILTASGRPVFVLVGEQPVYRDLGPGLEGEDVRQLEQALKRLGFDPGAADGVYDEATEAAVAEWYKSEGFTPFSTTNDQLAAIRALEKELITARLELLNARDLVNSAKLSLDLAEARRALALTAGSISLGSEVARAQAAAANQQAAAELAAKQKVVDELTGVIPPTPASSTEIAIAQADLAAAQANAELVRVTGVNAIADAQAARDALLADPGATAAAEANVTAVQAQANAANAAAAAEVAARKTALDVLLGRIPPRAPTPSEIAAAQAELGTAHANLEATRLAGEKLIAEAGLATATVSSDVTVSDTEVRAAQSAIGIGNQIVSQRAALTNLISLDLDLINRRAGVQVPADEIIFLSSDPVRVSEVSIVRGSELTGALMTVNDAVVYVDGSLPLDVAALVRPGREVKIDEPDLGIRASGIVTRVADAPGTNGLDGFHVYFEILVDQSPPNLVGTSVRLTVPVQSTANDVLAVPVSAISLGADGSSRVQRQVNGVLEVVEVEPGLSADGFVEVTPLAGTLRPGDLVLVGFDVSGPVAGG